jgi:succinoglycan biosynthesis protein ExoV
VLKLYYFKSADGVPNFGDDLNPWLWGQLLGDYLASESDTILSGIGTLLNERFPRARRTIVFGSGVGFGSSIPRIDDTWTFSCVRGPLSAQALGLPASLAITDPALFVADFLPKETVAPRHKFSYMPHYRNANDHWAAVCRMLGFGYVDPRAPMEDVLAGIRGSHVLIAEAMHGAIVADALGVPWIPVRTAGVGTLEFKWRDWCESLSLSYRPHHVVPIFAVSTDVRLTIKKGLAAAQLSWISRTAPPQLSDSRLRSQRLAQLHERLEQLKRDLEREKSTSPPSSHIGPATEPRHSHYAAEGR